MTTAISIGLFGGGLLVVRLADSSRGIYLDRVESQVFLTNDISANDPHVRRRPVQGGAQADRGSHRREVGPVPQPERRVRGRDQEVPAIQRRCGQGCVSRIIRGEARRPPRAAQGLRQRAQGSARCPQRAESEGLDRQALRGARRAECGGVRHRLGSGRRSNPADSQHGSGRGLHAKNGDRHHALGGREPLVHPAAVPRRGDAGRVHRRGDRDRGG